MNNVNQPQARGLQQPRQPVISNYQKLERLSKTPQNYYNDGDLKQWQPVSQAFQPTQNPNNGGSGNTIPLSPQSGMGEELQRQRALMQRPNKFERGIPEMPMKSMGTSGNAIPLSPQLGMGEDLQRQRALMQRPNKFEMGIPEMPMGAMGNAGIGTGQQDAQLQQQYLSALLEDFGMMQQGQGQFQQQQVNMPRNPLQQNPIQPPVQGMPMVQNPYQQPEQLGGMGGALGTIGNLGGAGMFGNQPPIQQSQAGGSPSFEQLIQQLMALQGGTPKRTFV